MSLIGSVIISARELLPDMPPTLPAPTAAAAVVASTGSTLPAGTYAVMVTQSNPWGETLPSAEVVALVVGANQGIQITSTLQPGATVIRAYLTLANGASGSEQQYVESSVSPFTISTPPTLANVPPTRNTAWLPDGNGKFLSAGTLYRWLNEGLRRLSRKVGGIQDYTGVGTTAGQPLYTMLGEWSKIDTVWYDGFPLSLGNQGGYFRRNTIQSSVLASCAVSIRTDRLVIELFYQPARTAGVSTLSAPMQAADTTAFVTSLTNFQSFGPPMFAMIGTEIVALSAISGTSLVNLLRGVGGTTPSAWNAGTVVQELNVPLLGKRLHTQQYTPNNAMNTLPLPMGWDSILPTYILSRSRDAEQDTQAASKYLKDFDDACQDFLRANRQIAGPTQVGGNAYGAATVPGFGSSMGGVVLP